MFASCTLLWGLMKPHILGVPDEKQAQPQPKKTPDLGIKDKVNIFKVSILFVKLMKRETFRKRCKSARTDSTCWHQVLNGLATYSTGVYPSLQKWQLLPY